MSTIMLPCGCWFSYSMFGDHEMMGLGLCPLHMGHPKVQETLVKDLPRVIRKILDDEPLEIPELQAMARLPHTWSVPSDERDGAGCLL